MGARIEGHAVSQNSASIGDHKTGKLARQPCLDFFLFKKKPMKVAASRSHNGSKSMKGSLSNDKKKMQLGSFHQGY